jgi:hypothetical protein
MLKLLALASFFALIPLAHAAVSEQESLAQPTRSTVIAPGESGSATQRLSLGVGSGVNGFTGNIGKLYSHSSAVLDLRGEWVFTPVFGALAGADLASYAFNATPVGAVEVKTQSLQLAGMVHFLSTALASSGFDPYAVGGASAVFRTQAFLSHNAIEKDNAVGLKAGLGTNYTLNGGKLGLFAEATVAQIYFQDRYQQDYLESGVNDMTGALVAARLGVKYYF